MHGRVPLCKTSHYGTCGKERTTVIYFPIHVTGVGCSNKYVLPMILYNRRVIVKYYSNKTARTTRWESCNRMKTDFRTLETGKNFKQIICIQFENTVDCIKC